MDRAPVTSSTVRSVGYDEGKQILEVEFKSGGIYQYMNVPKAVYERFMAASSKGRFLDQNIKPRYRVNKVK